MLFFKIYIIIMLFLIFVFLIQILLAIQESQKIQKELSKNYLAAMSFSNQSFARLLMQTNRTTAQIDASLQDMQKSQLELHRTLITANNNIVAIHEELTEERKMFLN